jgi:hypothetical protein
MFQLKGGQSVVAICGGMGKGEVNIAIYKGGR